MRNIAESLYREFRALDGGVSRRRFDKRRYDFLKGDEMALWLTASDEAEQELREQHIKEARLSPADREKRLTKLRTDFRFRSADRYVERAECAFSRSFREISQAGRPDVIDALLSAETAQVIRRICRRAIESQPMPLAEADGKNLRIVGTYKFRECNWPGCSRALPRTLARFADRFIEAKSDSRFPASSRPTSRLRRFWFLSRALAGAQCGVTTRTAINLLDGRLPEIAEEPNGF